MKTVRGLVLGALIGALVMTMVPAAAAPQPNNPSGDGVQPTIIPHFGGDDCTDPVVDTEATHSLRIPSPATGTFTDGTVVVNLVVNTSQRTVDFTITTPGWVAFDVVVKGGTNANHYDYLASAVGPQSSDTVLHSPPKGNRYDNLSHVTICYDEPPPLSISGTKFHDRDTDGVRDEVEEGLAGWTITAFNENGDVAATAVTNSDGNYSMVLGSGTFVVCEELQGAEGSFDWQESAPSGNDDCTGLGDGLAPAGYTVVLSNAAVTERNFGNHLAVVLGCGDSATLNEEGKPFARVTLSSEGCDSPTQAYPFDVGVNSDEGFTQFVVFGGAPVGTSVFIEEIHWLPYFLNYQADGTLVIKPTFVILEPGGEEEVIGVDCDPGQPNADVPDCRTNRQIDITSQPAGSEFDVQVDESEIWEFLGDPTRGKR